MISHHFFHCSWSSDRRVAVREAIDFPEKQNYQKLKPSKSCLFTLSPSQQFSITFPLNTSNSCSTFLPPPPEHHPYSSPLWYTHVFSWSEPENTKYSASANTCYCSQYLSQPHLAVTCCAECAEIHWHRWSDHC